MSPSFSRFSSSSTITPRPSRSASSACGVAARLKGGTQAAGGEGRSVRFATNKHARPTLYWHNGYRLYGPWASCGPDSRPLQRRDTARAHGQICPSDTSRENIASRPPLEKIFFSPPVPPPHPRKNHATSLSLRRATALSRSNIYIKTTKFRSYL